ncbi:glycerophosphoryl diester phosphodiesterase [Microbacteriaceae bacterium SG_E_30_P1]|uniref:Glycerophosphoryl diester phosphodiesterase n=1 Tax=Antiquaquibacter oligotrophicus TaxID=2880260 RepID=A0ABT6KLH0_9MICO|nr:glycerophosphodiester phosphodiesterase family protein [Antiquaquibacter oligotrophicus]MDH6180858.1 glycerophosphoryl diester phosphodiesterase [Antiquaquibacter oligotrophicus]UDF13428.1 glycerophosphodiester phosphodiesterase [Antiquaquibacter oligotrophicus]
MARALRPSSPAAAYFAPPLPRVFAHRGLATNAPENTLLAFAHAVSAGATYIETDVHASADGAAIVCHDEDLRRVAGRNIRVNQLTRSELARIDLGHGQGFVTLAEALDAFPQMRFNIDIKSRDAVAPTVATIEKLGAVDRVLLTSFNEDRRRSAVRALPGVATSASARVFLSALIAGKARASVALTRALRGVHAVQVPVRALGLAVATRPMIERLHAVGVEIHIWTINDPVDMAGLLDLGVDGIVTDRADLALELVGRRLPA